ncbi:MAG: hypothetical protein CVT79_03295 [Alphaproteobacteria bacterium HGW-Alphaproteobacteria-18]|nr:MAG: hypothetical protein CVT79_03295 [Alphaproteobacteria bacterium HGW-Alphaproteobacteria-18]
MPAIQAPFEHGLRCLLILMRAAQAPAANIPKGLTRAVSSGGARRHAPRFSLSLIQLAKDFARHGRDAAHLTSGRRRVAPPAAPALALAPAPAPRGPAASASVTDPAARLLARLEAIGTVFTDPQGYAAKFAATLRANGLCFRALKSLIPSAALWQLTSHRAGDHNHALPTPAPNTS